MALLRMPLETSDGAYLVAEVDPSDLTGEQLVADDGAGHMVKATGTLAEALSHVEPAVRLIISRLQVIAPDEMTVDFGLKIGGEAGIIWAEGPAEANISVSVTWKHREAASNHVATGQGTANASQPS